MSRIPVRLAFSLLALVGCSDTLGVVVVDTPIIRVDVSPEQRQVGVDSAFQFSVVAVDSSGNTVAEPGVEWVSSDATIATVSETGTVTGHTVGTALIIAAAAGLADTAQVSVLAAQEPPVEEPAPAPPPEEPEPAPPPEEPEPAPPVASEGEFVVFPSEEVAFIIGPQLVSGSAANPWPWFDENAIERGHAHGQAFPAEAPQTSVDAYLLLNYYDQALVQYTNYYRTGDPAFLAYARKIADSWWQLPHIAEGTADPEMSLTPRLIALNGLILRALDGRPEMWPWIVDWVRIHYFIWLERSLNDPDLHYGIRDGGFVLLYAAVLAKVHPDPTIREEFLSKALVASTDYYARLQYPDGSWRWTGGASGIEGYFTQPFMVGMLLEGLIAVHRLTNDAIVRESILKAVDNLYTVLYRPGPVPDLDANWRGFWYFYYGNDCGSGCGKRETGGNWVKVHEVRQLNSTNTHVFGYAYRITGDSKYIVWGDDIFAATFGRGRGPGADQGTGLAYYRAKEYNQSYRAGGRYLAWRVQP